MRSLHLVLQCEGGYVDHPRDPGGATNRGITLATLSEWRKKPCTKEDVKALSMQEAASIYHTNYWSAVDGDQLPLGVDFVTFDYAVNSGTATATKALQSCVGAVVDGVIGPYTIRAVETYCKRHGAAELIGAYCDRRLVFLKALKTWPTFGSGWFNRVQKVRAEALKMVSPT